jgi:hypothetical protein
MTWRTPHLTDDEADGIADGLHDDAIERAAEREDDELSEPEYQPLRAWAAEGARVGLSTCSLCGAALLVDAQTGFDVFDRHTRWHAEAVSDY